VTRSRILITGANGNLGQALLRHLGPELSIAATRDGKTVPPEFEHVALTPDGVPPTDALERCRAVINAAGSVKGDEAALDAANIRLPLSIAAAAKAAGVPKIVQVSSLAIHGTTELIDHQTPERPINAYGRSKAAGDRAIKDLIDEGFAVESLRLPFMFSVKHPGLLSPLLTLASTARILPSVSGAPLRRSMLSYKSAAGQLVDCAMAERSGISFAADPLLFDYPLLISILAEEANINVRLVPVPRAVATAIDKLLPAIGRRLLRSSILASDANRANGQRLDLEGEIRGLVRERYRK
jgi:hypothetical protein